MVRRALWRARSDDTQGALRWFVSSLPRGWMPLPVAFLAAGIVGALAFGWNPGAALLLPLVAMQVRCPLQKEALATLATVPPPGPAFACRVEIRRGDVLLGEDVGVLTFVQGWLHFMGERTEFSLSRDDVRASGLGRFVLARQPIPARLDGMSLRRLRGSPVVLEIGNESVAFEPLAAWDATEMFEDRTAVSDGFLRAFGFWRHDAFAAKGESILPPSGLHPSGTARAFRDATFAVALGLILVFALSFAFPGSHFLGVAFTLLAMPAAQRLRAVWRLAQNERRALPASGVSSVERGA